MIKTSNFTFCPGAVFAKRQLVRVSIALFLMLFCISCSGTKSRLTDGDGLAEPIVSEPVRSCAIGIIDTGLEDNVWLSEVMLEGAVTGDSSLTVFLGYLESMGASPSGVLPPTADDVEIENQAKTGARYHFPLVMNAKVSHFISYYSTVQNRFMHRSLARSHRYLTMMRKVLREHHIPEELAYMVLIESGFTTHAYSRARACGPWQFISATGRRYGLKINSWVDERRDPVKATYAAVAYLGDLYEMFGSWYLAAAAYNAGEGKIQRAMRRHKTDDFW
ncbi:lytic transglycosylase domain-containing protein, partial [bacterium]|nr:lytic transglycosylase domain-containing protein [bacterium]